MGTLDYQRLAYDDADTASAMGRDCRLVADLLPPARLGTSPGPVGSSGPSGPVGSLGEPTRHDKVKRPITVDEAARRLAAALHLHLD
jgi:hypothetical protein